MMANRRLLMAGVFSMALTGGIFRALKGGGAEAEAGAFEVAKPEAEWRRELTPEQFYVLREHGTERAGTSPLDKELRTGTFLCAGCDKELFASQTKFNSGTGWPSFYDPMPGAVDTKDDTKFFMSRTEVHCHRCGGHLGHVFDDGPAPTGKRYCMNGAAMKFKPSA